MPQDITQDPILQGQVAEARKRGYSNDQIQEGLLKAGAKAEEVSRLLAPPPEQGPSIFERGLNYLKEGGGRFADRFNQEQIQPTLGVLGQGVQIIKDNYGIPPLVLQGLMKQGLQNAIGIGEGIIEGTDPNRPVGGRLDAIPIVGPAVRMMDRMNPANGQGWDPAGALSDATGLLAQLLGERVVKGATGPIRRGGRALYQHAWGDLDPNMPLASREAAIQQAWDSGIVQRRGHPARAEAAKAQVNVDAGDTAVRTAIQNYESQGGPPALVREPAREVLSSIERSHAMGQPNQARPFESQLQPYVETRTGIPYEGEYMDNPESPGEYITRALANDPTVPVSTVQTLKRLFGQKEREANATKTRGELISQGSSESVYNSLMEKGHRQTVRERVPEVQQGNEIQRQNIAIRDVLENLADQDPSRFAGIAHYLIGAGMGWLLSGIGIKSGNMPLQYAGGHTLGGLAKLGAVAAAEDPVITSQLGQWAGHFGDTGIPKIIVEGLGNLPRTNVVSGGLSSQQARKNQQGR
jgi:hypothetical protein